MSNHTLPQRAQRGGPSARLCCMQSALKLKAGDILIFAKLPSGELLLGGRARTAADKDRKAPPRARKSEGGPGANGAPAAAGIKRPRPAMPNGAGAALRPDEQTCMQPSGVQCKLQDRACVCPDGQLTVEPCQTWLMLTPVIRRSYVQLACATVAPVQCPSSSCSRLSLGQGWMVHAAAAGGRRADGVRIRVNLTRCAALLLATPLAIPAGAGVHAVRPSEVYRFTARLFRA